MNFELSEDQVALRDGARALLHGYASPVQVRAVVDADAGADAVLWQAIVEQGWLGVAVGERDGGLGFGSVEVAVLLEEVGRHAAPGPIAPTILAIDALMRAGAGDEAARLVAGEVGSVAWSREPDAVRAEEANGSWRLTGQPAPTVAAPSAALVVVVAATSEGPGLFVVDAGESTRPGREPAMDRTRELGWCRFDGEPARRLGGEEAVSALVDRGATYAAAEMLGGASRVLDLSTEYAKDRVQFGRPIGSFQAVKHRCADMLVDVEGMRSTAYWAAWCVSADDPDASIAASTAKIWCSDASKRVMGSGLQVHGGIGFTWEHDLHFFLKRAKANAHHFGDARWHRAKVANLAGL